VKLLSIFALTALALTSPALAVPIPTLQARPTASATGLVPGVTKLSAQAIAYEPRSAANPTPLILFLADSSIDADTIVEQYRGEADKRGAILLALDPSGGGWTLKPGANGAADFGADPQNIDTALQALFVKAAIDPSRSVIVGHADAANYALAVGLTNPKLFHGIVAMTPSGLWLPSTGDKSQRIFLSHGMRDDVVPFKNTRDTIAPGLKSNGFAVVTEWPNEGHDIDRRMVAAGLDAVMAPAR